MPITHIFFDLHGTLIDGYRLHPCYSASLGKVMAERFGETPDVWREANRRVLADWDSYYADLNLSGDDGIEHMWEGLLRTTRGMFRLAGVREPDMRTLTALSREIPGLATRRCDALYPDCRAVIEQLAADGFVLGVTSHAITVQAQGLLAGAGIRQYFSGPIVGPDTAERFQKDGTFYRFAARKAGVRPEECLTIDDTAMCVSGAKRAGMYTVLLSRRAPLHATEADYVLNGDLNGLIDVVKILAQ
jgi:HAD superfamily hydrolase (TIGR01509 family)